MIGSIHSAFDALCVAASFTRVSPPERSRRHARCNARDDSKGARLTGSAD
ncbi:hypothetical protein C7S13_4191 [Burkholderia cepacia]|nr:hypothetical protein [Burkholderia cepacia]